MIESFFASFELFGATYLVGALIAAVLALVGVWVVARDHIFLGAAVSQASTLGVAAALWLGGSAAASELAWLESVAVAPILAVAASVGTAWLASRAGASTTETPEAVTGWIFLLAASVPTLMLAHSPHGLEEIHRLVFSTLLAASRSDLVTFAVLALATAGISAAAHRPLTLFAMDPPMALAVGMRPGRWNAGTALWLGTAVGLSIRTAGMLYTFGCLVLPALVAKHLCREVRPMLWVAPLLAVAASATGSILSQVFDLPPAHVTVGLLCLGLLVAWMLGARRA